MARGGCEAREAELVAAPGMRHAAPQRQHELELRSAMAATALGASGNAREGGKGRSGARLWRSKSTTGGRARGQRRAAMVEASSRMAAMHGARVAP